MVSSTNGADTIPDLRYWKTNSEKKSIWNNFKQMTKEHSFEGFDRKFPITSTWISNGLASRKIECMPANERFSSVTIFFDYCVFKSGLFGGIIKIDCDCVLDFLEKNKAVGDFAIVVRDQMGCNKFVEVVDQKRAILVDFLCDVERLTVIGDYPDTFLALIRHSLDFKVPLNFVRANNDELMSQVYTELTLSENNVGPCYVDNLEIRPTLIKIGENGFIMNGDDALIFLSVPQDKIFDFFCYNVASSAICFELNNLDVIDRFAKLNKNEIERLKQFMRGVEELSFSGLVTPSYVKLLLDSAPNVTSLYFDSMNLDKHGEKVDNDLFYADLKNCLSGTENRPIERLWMDFSYHENVALNGILPVLETVYHDSKISFLRLLFTNAFYAPDIDKCLKWIDKIVKKGGHCEIYMYEWRKEFAKGLYDDNNFRQINDVQYWNKSDKEYLRWFISYNLLLRSSTLVTIYLARKWVQKVKESDGKFKYYDRFDHADFSETYKSR